MGTLVAHPWTPILISEICCHSSALVTWHIRGTSLDFDFNFRNIMLPFLCFGTIVAHPWTPILISEICCHSSALATWHIRGTSLDSDLNFRNMLPFLCFGTIVVHFWTLILISEMCCHPLLWPPGTSLAHSWTPILTSEMCCHSSALARTQVVDFHFALSILSPAPQHYCEVKSVNVLLPWVQYKAV